MANPLRSILISLHGRLIGLASDGTLIVKGMPDQVTLTPAAGAAASNICNVTIQAVDNEGNPFAGVVNGDLWLSDAASGAGLTAVTASGSVVAGSAGADMGDYTSKKAKRIQTDATGKYVLSLTDTAKTAFFVCVALDDAQYVAPNVKQLASGNYG